MTFNPKLDLRLERIIDVPIELVWEAWTNPEHLKPWFCPKPWSVSKCEIDLRPGGKFNTTMNGPNGEVVPNQGSFLIVEPLQKLVFTDALLEGYRPAGKGFMTASIELERVGDKTRYIATAYHANSEDQKTHSDMGFESGWGTALDQLIEYCKTM